MLQAILIKGWIFKYISDSARLFFESPKSKAKNIRMLEEKYSNAPIDIQNAGLIRILLLAFINLYKPEMASITIIVFGIM